MVEMMEASRQYQNNLEVLSTMRALMMRTSIWANKLSVMMEIGNNPSAQTQKEILDKLGKRAPAML